MGNIGAHISLFIVALIYGGNYIIAKELMNDGMISPFAFILCRCIAGVILFWLTGLFFIREKVDKSDYLRLIIVAFFGIALNQLCFFSGLAITSPIHGSLIMVLTPVIILVLSAIFLHEKVGLFKVIGITMGLIGAILLILEGKSDTSGISSVQGDLLILVNASSYACYVILVKGLLEKYHPITIVRWAYTFGIVFIMPFGLFDLLEVDWSTYQSSHWLAFAYVLFFTTFLAYLLNALALKRVRPEVLGAYIYLQPFIASIISIAINQDVLTRTKLVSAAFIFIGLYLVIYAKNLRKRMLAQ